MEQVDEKFFACHELKFKSVIAKGGYGIVYLVYSTHYQQDFALKRVLESHFKQDEVNTMMKMHGPHICNLYQYFYFENYVYLLLEYCPHSLIDVLGQYDVVPQDVLLKYMYQIMLGLDMCHNHHIAHSDIKPQNVLIGAYGRAKLCDFGLAREVHQNESHTVQGSLCFMAPEILRGVPYDPMKADIWSLGVTFFYMATKTYPFSPRLKPDQLISFIMEGVYDEGLVKPIPIRLLIARCLKINPNDRPSIEELLLNPIFKDVSTKPTPLQLAHHTLTVCHPKLGATSRRYSHISSSAKNIVIHPRMKKIVTPTLLI